MPLDPIRLRSFVLDDIAARGVPVPRYERTTLQPRILHIGVGGFHRAHLALYTHELAEMGSDWGIRGLGVLAADQRMADVLDAQDRLYTLIEKGGGEPRPQVIGSIIDYVLAVDDPAAIASQIANRQTLIVSLTVTEAGYSLDTPNPTFDAIARGLGERWMAGATPVTVLSCDNLPGNGDAARAATLASCHRYGAAFVAWVEANCAFPNSMVDRITPQTSDADREWLLRATGIEDGWPVVAEPFRQWVLEDTFAAGRPRWEDVGALFTDRVHDWELYKLRMLNAGHSCMACLCSLAGITYVDEGVATPEVRAYLDRLLYHEAIPTLSEIPGHPREDYAASVLERFANTGVRDQIARLCIDGTAKFPTFLIPTIEAQLTLGGPIECGALALAGWARYLETTPPEVRSADASADIAVGHASRAAGDPVAFLDFSEVFPATLRNNERFRAAFVAASERLAAVGPLAAMAEVAV
jgi:mannitol 2-dehydrogenase